MKEREFLSLVFGYPRLLISFHIAASILILFLPNPGPALPADSPVGQSFDLANLSYVIYKMG